MKFKLTILAIPVVLYFALLGLPVSSTWYVRSDGGTANQCTGLVDAAYPGSGTGQPCALASLPNAVSASSCGDTIRLKNGQTFDFSSPVSLNKTCTLGSPLTITSTASLPGARVAPADAINMPRLRAVNSTGGVFKAAANAAYWIIDGLEITDANTGTNMTQFLLDFGESVSGVNNMTVQRCYLHPKETGASYTRSVVRAIQFEGSFLTFKWNYASGFLGVGADGGGLMTSEVILSVGGDNVTLHDNYMGAWYSSIFTGGGGSSPTFTATVTNSSTTSGTFSSTTGLAAGILVRFSISGTGSISSGSLTRNGGGTLTSADVNRTVHLTPTGGGPVYRAKLLSVSGNTYSLSYYNTTAPDGTYDWVCFETAMVNSVSGSTVNYTPYGPNQLVQAPSGAAWRTQSTVHDWTVTRNTFNIDYDFGVYAHDNLSNNPKGFMELKDMDNMLLEGNEFTGYPSTMVMNARSNEGFTPWCTMRNIAIRSNYYHPAHNVGGEREFAIIALRDPDNSSTPGSNVNVTNNLILNTALFLQTQGMDSSSVVHNTVFNVGNAAYGHHTVFAVTPSTNWTFSDNIVGFNTYGINCTIDGNLNTCFPNRTISKNVAVDNQGVSFSSNAWGSGGILTPIVSAFTSVGFTNQGGGNYRLSASSPYKGLGTGGSDPGVDQNALETATGGVFISGTIGQGAAGLQGVTVNLLNSANRALIDSALTNAAGSYVIAGPKGATLIVVPVKAGYSFTPTETLFTANTDTTINFSSNAPTPTPTPTATPTPTPTPTPTVTPTPTATPTPTVTPTPTPTPPPPSPTPTPTPGALPVCKPNQIIGNPKTCRCLTTPTQGVGNPKRCK